jgi:hypothetical protein
MPERLPNPQGYKPFRRPFLPADAFDTLRHVNQKMLIIVGDIIRNDGCPVEHHAALLICQQQLDAIAELCYGKP